VRNHKVGQTTTLIGNAEKLLQIGKRVGDDVQTGQTQVTDQERLYELTQQVAVDDWHEVYR
jgi:hypothetical protein